MTTIVLLSSIQFGFRAWINMKVHLFNPNWTGGGSIWPPPLSKFYDYRKTAADINKSFHDFFLWSLAQLLVLNLRRLTKALQGHVTIKGQRSLQNGGFSIHVCTTEWRCYGTCEIQIILPIHLSIFLVIMVVIWYIIVKIIKNIRNTNNRIHKK